MSVGELFDRTVGSSIRYFPTLALLALPNALLYTSSSLWYESRRPDTGTTYGTFALVTIASFWLWSVSCMFVSARLLGERFVFGESVRTAVRRLAGIIVAGAAFYAVYLIYLSLTREVRWIVEKIWYGNYGTHEALRHAAPIFAYIVYYAAQIVMYGLGAYALCLIELALLAHIFENRSIRDSCAIAFSRTMHPGSTNRLLVAFGALLVAQWFFPTYALWILRDALAGSALEHVAVALFDTASDLLVGIFSPVLVTMLYYDNRVRTEALDLQIAASQLSAG